MGYARGSRLARLAYAVLATVAAAPHLGCGGGAGGGGGGLTGLVETDRFEVPAGQTQQVTGETTIRSTGEIVIAGELRITPGASLALVANGELAIDGAISPAAEPASARTREDAELADAIVLFAPRIRIGTEPGPSEPASETTTIKAPTGTNVFIAVPPDDPNVIGDTSVVIHGAVVAGDGEDALAPDEPGEGFGALPGCHVEVGTAQAIAKANEASGTETAMAPSQIRIEALVKAGDGGDGGDDTTVPLRGSAGADGGDVRLVAGAIVASDIASRARVQGGQGGRGGGIVYRGVDGTGAGEAGEDVQCITGDGGDGGDVVLDATERVEVGGGEFNGGRRGIHGGAEVAAGNGGPGGDGGDLGIELGLPGTFGETSVPGAFRQTRLEQPEFAAEIRITDSGNGGSSIHPELAGGKGGFVAIQPRDLDPLATPFTRLSFVSSNNGGDGFDACGLTPPGPGSDGGSVDRVPLINEALFRDFTTTIFRIENSFNGGDGGDGNPAGSGGTAGRDFLLGQSDDDLIEPLGLDGRDGEACPPDDGGGGDQGGSVVEQEPNSDCASATPMGNATTGLGQGNGGSDDDAFKKDGLTIGKYRVTTSVAMNLDIVAGEFQSLNFPVAENGFADVSIRDLPGMICFRIGRLAPDETYSFTIEKISDDPDAQVPPP